MAAAVAITGTKNAGNVLTISLTGFATSTVYNVLITGPSGASTVLTAPATDGSGNTSVTYTPSIAGTLKVDTNIVPTSVATATATIGNPSSG
jgi:hypothetical protein